jgi:hypothetical protein
MPLLTRMLFACSPNSVDGGKAKQTGAISDDMSSAGWFVPLPGGRGVSCLTPHPDSWIVTAHPDQGNIIGANTDKNGRNRE